MKDSQEVYFIREESSNARKTSIEACCEAAERVMGVGDVFSKVIIPYFIYFHLYYFLCRHVRNLLCLFGTTPVG